MVKSQSIDEYKGNINKCLDVLKKGHLEDLYKILPQIGVLKSETFLPPLLTLLRDDDQSKQEFAAHGLGALAEPQALKPLFETFTDPKTHKGKNRQLLQTAIIDAIGEIGTGEAVEILNKILNFKVPGDPFEKRRKELVVEALGAIAQQGEEKALEVLVKLLEDSDPSIRVSIIPEISVAFWHRPNEISDVVFNKLVQLTRDKNPSICYTAFLELKTLSDLGCRKAAALRIPDKYFE